VIAMLLAGLSAGWLMARLAAHFRPAVLPPRDPATVIVPTLLVWIVFTAAASLAVPRAAFLWVLPLVALAAPLAIAGPARAAIASGGVAALLVASVLWIRDTWALISFLVPLLGGFPMVTPVWVLPAVLLACAAVVVPPALTLLVATPVGRPRFLTRALLVSTGFAMAWAYDAPAYTPERPLRMSMVSVSGEPGGTITMVSANEPIASVGPGGLTLTPAPAPPDRLARYLGGAPFVAIAPPQEARNAGRSSCQVAGNHVTVTLEGLDAARVMLELPASLVPTASEPPGVLRGGRWSAALVGQPSGAAFSLTLAGDADRACDGRLYAVRPGPTPAPGDPPAPVVWQPRLVDVLTLR
jgi:hypothetical protein